ncbi:P-loop NTPase [candidate division GN15 bacterium]|nr:P-loop NTPase [candidate division GN15 bacterium]
MAGVKHIIAVASGKGGVGKSTVSANLAVALRERGFSVGLMDADIYGPSQPGMLGAGTDKAGITEEQKLTPVNRHGIDFISIGLLMEDDSPVIWRAPIAMKMIMQFIGAVEWGERDFLLIDLPPGTGDVQLTLAQQASLSGAVIVTTPQDVALGVARKGLRMFEQVNVPVLGIIENMSGFTCKHCGKETAIFKEGGGRAMAEQLGVPYLSSIPLDPVIMMSGEEGVPVLHQDKGSAASEAFLTVADNLSAQLDKHASAGGKEPEQMSMTDKGELVIDWPGGEQTRHTPYNLRLKCTCANCIDEDTGKQILDTGRVPLDISITDIKAVGRYGVSISFSDGHSTGIYTFDHLRSIDESGQQGDKGQSFSV